MVLKVPHYIESNGGKIGFLAPDTYSAISDTVGVKKVTDSDVLSAFVEVDDLKQSGVATHVWCRVNFGSGPARQRKIVCAIDKVSTAIAALRGKNYAGGTIRTARIKRERDLY